MPSALLSALPGARARPVPGVPLVPQRVLRRTHQQAETAPPASDNTHAHGLQLLATIFFRACSIPDSCVDVPGATEQVEKLGREATLFEFKCERCYQLERPDNNESALPHILLSPRTKRRATADKRPLLPAPFPRPSLLQRSRHLPLRLHVDAGGRAGRGLAVAAAGCGRARRSGRHAARRRLAGHTSVHCTPHTRRRSDRAMSLAVTYVCVCCAAASRRRDFGFSRYRPNNPSVRQTTNCLSFHYYTE